MKKDARFYFANLGADVARCISSLQANHNERYRDSLDRAYHTLAFLREINRPEVYEEGLLLLRGLEQARTERTLPVFKREVTQLITEYSPIL